MNEHAERPPQPTSSLKQFDILVGEWNMLEATRLSHPQRMGILLSNG